MDNGRSPIDHPVSVVLTDVDGTLLTKEKVLTEQALLAVKKLRERGIVFTITSGRPPFGMRMLVAPLGLTVPMAAFNGGAIVMPDLSVLDERGLPEYLLPALIDVVQSHGLDVWLFRTSDWIVRSAEGPRVAREMSNIQTPPVVVSSFDDSLTGVVKMVGTGMDPARVAACEAAVRQTFGTQVFAARTGALAVDITDPSVHKGAVIERLSRFLRIPLERIAALGDQINDIPMLQRAGLSIAMGNADDEVKRNATFVTTSFADEGFANAVEHLILPRAEPAGGSGVRPTAWLHRLGQSLWLDNITREMLRTGTLERAIEELSVSGLTSSPTIFYQAIKNDAEYSAAIADRAHTGKSPEELFFDLALEDLKQAADLLRAIHDRSNGIDGWVSVEVSPLLANDASETVAAAKALFERAGRPNLMIMVPGTPAMLPAIEEAIFLGVPINVTLLFSREQYLAAADAFLRGIERRMEAGLNPLVTSVASVFVSPWDTAVAGKVPDHLRNQLGIAMAQRTYKTYRSLLLSPRWQHIYNAGGRPQRVVWADTGVDEPAGSALAYIRALTAPFTVLTMPPSTLEAIADHGEITGLLRADGGNCEEVLDELTAAGIDLYALANQLQDQATKSLDTSWSQLMSLIAAKTATFARRTG